MLYGCPQHRKLRVPGIDLHWLEMIGTEGIVNPQDLPGVWIPPLELIRCADTDSAITTVV